MYYNNRNKKKVYLSDPIKTELQWVNDLPWTKRIWYCKLNLKIQVVYTYYIYHNYTVAELAQLNDVSEEMLVDWLLMAAYVVDGKYVRLDGEGFVEKMYMRNVYERFPKAEQCPKCKECVWADMRTNHRLCFRYCKHDSCFQRRCSSDKTR